MKRICMYFVWAASSFTVCPYSSDNTTATAPEVNVTMEEIENNGNMNLTSSDMTQNGMLPSQLPPLETRVPLLSVEDLGSNLTQRNTTPPSPEVGEDLFLQSNSTSDITQDNTRNNQTGTEIQTERISGNDEGNRHDLNTDGSVRLCDFGLGPSGGETVSFCTFNKTKAPADDFLKGAVCLAETSTLAMSGQCLDLETFPCGYDAGCETYGYCCHDRVTDLTAASPSTGCLQSGSYAFITCPARWGDEDVRDRCKRGLGRYTSEDPVSDLSTGITFRNEFCAACHGVTSFSRWQLKVTCDHFQFVYAAVTEHDFMELVMNHTDLCKVKREPPQVITPQPCPDPSWLRCPVINSCNVTGDWKDKDYDVDVEKNCALYKALALQIRSRGHIFQNLFCAACNGILPVIQTCQQPDSTETDENKLISGPLSLLLGLQGRERQGAPPDTLDCLPGQWEVLKNECRNLTCPAGKLLQNDTCTTALTQIRGLSYFVNVTLTPTSVLSANSPLSIDMLEHPAREMLLHKLEGHVSKYALSVSFIFLELSWSVYELEHIKVSGEVTAPRDINRDEAESEIIERVFSSFWTLRLSIGSTTLKRDSLPSSAFQKSARKTKRLKIGRPFYYERTYQDQYLPLIPPDLRIPLTPMLTCPHLEFEPSEYKFHGGEENDTRLVLLAENKAEVHVEDFQLTWLDDDGKLYMCLDDLNNLTRPTRDRGSSLPPSWQYVLTMVLMPLSMLCLVLTLVVYCLLPALRTQPGLNTMGTCCALLVAQLSLLLAVHRVTSGPSCQALGVVVHLSWLSVFCWTFVCSLHMFRVFSAKTYHRSSSHRCRKLVVNLILTLAVPGGVVAAVVVATCLTTDGDSIGYSERSCYLDSTLLVGVAMVLPISLILLLNLLFFVLTVRRIHMVAKLNPHSEDQADSQNHVRVCARLSVLTGVTWMLSLLAEGLGVGWLQFFSIVANGGQGVLLFLSYVTNRRVAAMLAVRLGLREEIKSSTSSSSRTAATTLK